MSYYNTGMNSHLKEAKTVHFSGIGGIGISAIARMLLSEGKAVSGSDREGTVVTDELERLGASISLGGQKRGNIPPGCDLLVYTNALGTDNPELAEARERNIPMLSYPQALNEISREKYTIAIAGTHGKTTVTAMTAQILLDAKLDPTVIVGSLMKSIGSNFVAGKGEYFIVEADEYRRSFLNLEPKILAINNLDLDHLDYFKDLADIQSAFRELAEKIPADGFLVCDKSDPNILPVITGLRCCVLNYPDADISALRMKVHGGHNRKNAQVAATIAFALRISPEAVRQSLSGFEGTWRRFEYKGETETGALVYDDYAHNPQKVRAALQGAREEFPGKRIVVVFQPHLYSRTKTLFDDFKRSFKGADELILAPIFAAREENDPTISSELLAAAIAAEGVRASSLPDFDSIRKTLEGILKSGDVLITMGAGDVYKIGEELTRKTQ